MAIYHLSVKTVSRSAGRSATAAAAYRAAELIACAREGRVHDYTRKQGVAHTEIIVPAEAIWARDRAALWNAAETAEKRVNSTVAREYEVALPGELSAAGRITLVRAFAREVCDRYGVAVDFAIHAPNRDGDQRNWHAHVLTTTRRAEAEGLGPKTRILDDQKSGPEQVKDLRRLWAELTNKALEREQCPERVTHKSFETLLGERRAVLARAEPGSAEAIAAQRDAARYETLFEARAPHAGPAATNMERKAERRAERDGRAYEPATRIGAQMARAREVEGIVFDYMTAFDVYMRARSGAAEKQREKNKPQQRASDERRAESVRTQSCLRTAPRSKIVHLLWLERGAPDEFAEEALWKARRDALRAAQAARKAAADRLAKENEASKKTLLERAAEAVRAFSSRAVAIAARVLEREVEVKSIQKFFLLKYDDLKRHDWLEGPTRYAIDAFIRWLSDAAERTLTDAQRARLNEQREEAYRNRFDDDARPGLVKRAMQSFLKPAVLRRLEAAQSDLDALYEAVKPIEMLVAEYNARQPEPVDAALDEAVRIARQRLDEETKRQQEAWRDRQPLPEDLAWLALQPPDVIAAARALNDAEDAAERKAAQEAERERLADDASAKLADRIEALRAGFAASVADWKAARADNASRVAAHEEELDELHARLRELARPVKAALSGEADAAAVSRGEDALTEIRDLVDEARALLEPPPPSNDYGWSPFEP